MILNNCEARLWTTALAFQGYGMSLSCLPRFVAKASSSERFPLPSFLFVRSLEAFVAILLGIVGFALCGLFAFIWIFQHLFVLSS